MKINIKLLMLIFVSLVLLNINCAIRTKKEDYIKREISIIPKPAKMLIGKGEFIISSKTKILVEAENKEIKGISEYLAKMINKTSGYNLIDL
ncbi:hypothetical protein ES703_34274 [subsurface metagenome]